MSKDVFISYKSDEFDTAFWIYNSFKENGVSAWMAPMDIPGGSSYALEITNAIKNCQVFVLVLSNASQQSKWIPKEIDSAINAQKLILPFMIEKCELNAEFSFLLSNIQFKEAYADREKALSELISEIRVYLSSKKSDKPSSEETKNPADISAVSGKEREVKKPKKEKSMKNGKKKKMSILKKIAIALICIPVAYFLFAIIFGIVMMTINEVTTKTVMIAGKEYVTTIESINITETTLTAEDIAAIGTLEELTAISLTSCKLETASLSELSDTGLQKLTVSDCGVTQEMLETIAFADMANLTGLDISANKDITDIPGNKSLSGKITVLNISSTSINDISVFYDANKDSLIELDISFTAISDLSFLENNQRIKILHINGIFPDSLKSLEGCIYLTKIYASGNELTSLSGIDNCTLLNTVDFSGNKLTDISILKKSAEYLEEVNISENEITDLSPIAECKNLISLDFSSNKIEDISCLGACTKLTSLKGAKNQIRSLSGIDPVKHLKYLDLSSNYINELPFVINVEENAEVYLNNNNITELKINTLTKISVLHIQQNSITDTDIFKKLFVNDLHFDYSDKIDFSALSPDIHDFTLYNCPLDKKAAISKLHMNADFA